MNKTITFTLLSLLCVTACGQQTLTRTLSAAAIENENTYAPVVIPSLPQNLDFAGETVPMENYDTRESLTRELLSNIYLHSRTAMTLMATTRYFPIIEPILKQYGIPEDFKYLCMAESGLDPDVRSGAGAAGLWQLMQTYAKSAGLFIDNGVDERYDVVRSTEAACKYLKDAKNRLGSWTLAAASYNVGVAGVNRRLEKQGVSSYYDLYLPDETMRYVFRLLAFKLITQSPELYGYRLAAENYFPPLKDYREVEVDDAQIDWSAVARAQGTTYKMLRELNHWIRDYEYNNKERRRFVLKIPAATLRNAQ